jgi:hypothetical protein
MWRIDWNEKKTVYNGDADCVKLMEYMAYNINCIEEKNMQDKFPARILVKCPAEYLHKIKSPDGQTDWSRAVYCIYLELEKQKCTPAFDADVLEIMERWLENKRFLAQPRPVPLPPEQYPMCAEILMNYFEGFKLPVVWKHEKTKAFDIYMKNHDSVGLLTWCAKYINIWATWTGVKREMLTRWEVPDLNSPHLPPQIMSPDGLSDWTRILWLLQISTPISPPSMQDAEKYMRENTRCPENAIRRRARWQAAQPRPPMDAAAIQRIQKWPQCATLIENFMRRVEQAWQGMEERTHVEKWRDQVYYSRDPANHINEDPRNPIDALEYWAHVMSAVREYAATMQTLKTYLEYAPNQPSVLSPPSSIMPDWTFAVHVLRWMVIHDPTVDEVLRNAYKTDPLSLDLIDDIEHMYSDTADSTAAFLRAAGAQGPDTPFHAQVSRRLIDYTRPPSPAQRDAEDQTLALCIEKLEAYCERFKNSALRGFYGRIITSIRAITKELQKTHPDTTAISKLIIGIQKDEDENQHNSKFRDRFGNRFKFKDKSENIMDTLDILPTFLPQETGRHRQHSPRERDSPRGVRSVAPASPGVSDLLHRFKKLTPS